MFLIRNPNNGETQFVASLQGYEVWEVLAMGEEACPKEGYVLEAGKWRKPLAMAKAEKLAQAKEAMRHVRQAGLNTPYGVFDCDFESQTRLANCLAQMGQGSDVSWTLQDNSSQTLTKGQLKEVCSLMQAMENSLHGRMQSLRASLKNASTVEEVEALQF